ncbi:hypothetical protein K470DRAFT_214440 [Piedraia hortae CBS 480.64]|uniref:Mitochondrial carrier n=1 Tax=Piedraia hortae CBS 480.64 TaxID=1314780 RepID=A0A6A7C383_9PEZI|nr:hypothetical protein K470DRAFT_214440 [Piedraia hortae CBS 480.64]
MSTLLPRRTILTLQRSSFSSLTSLRAGKESELHNENRANEADKHKHDQLEKAKSGKNNWSEKLASDSEESVKADRGDMNGSGESVADLQKQSTEKFRKGE